MGDNESKEVDASLLAREGEDDIFRDLLEVDGCESSWQDGDRRAEALRKVEEKEALAPVVAEQQTQEDGGPDDGVLVEASNRALKERMLHRMVRRMCLAGNRMSRGAYRARRRRIASFYWAQKGGLWQSLRCSTTICLSGKIYHRKPSFTRCLGTTPSQRHPTVTL